MHATSAQQRGGEEMDEDKFYSLYRKIQIILVVQTLTMLFISIKLLCL